MDLKTYRAFTQRLQDNLEADEQILGLIACGSMAEQGRLPDAWSDHDFFVITVPNVQESYRQNLAWLPDAENIVLQIRETAHGLKVLYANGHLLEFAVFDLEELKLAQVNDYRILFERAAEPIHLRTKTDFTPVDMAHEFSMMLALFFVGAGRAARGEVLSGHVFIKQHALGHLLQALQATLPTANERLDNLDPFRRVEQVFPELSTAIAAALLLPPIQSAQALLKLAAQELESHIDAYPAQAVTVVADYLRQLPED